MQHIFLERHIKYITVFTNCKSLKKKVRSKNLCPVLTVREYTMMSLMNSITDKPNWNTKIWDSELIVKMEE